MYTFMFVMHILITVSLIGVILVQRGRSGGLVEALGGVESIFGTKTSSFFVKMTVGLAIAFFCSSIALAYLSRQRGASIMDKYAKPAGAPAKAGSANTTAVVPVKPAEPVVSPKAEAPAAAAVVPTPSPAKPSTETVVSTPAPVSSETKTK